MALAMRMISRGSFRWTRRIGGLLLALVGSTALAAQTSILTPWPSGRSQVKFEIRVRPAVRAEPLTGRVYVILTHDETREPRLQVGRVGAPLFGRDVERLAPAQPATIRRHRSRHAGRRHGRISGRATTGSSRSSTSTPSSSAPTATCLWMHDDQWEGQNWAPLARQHLRRAASVSISIRASAQVVALTADTVIPPIAPIPDDDFVQRFKIQSPDADEVLGPADLSRRRRCCCRATTRRPTISYPVNYIQGHFGLNAPYGFSSDGRGGRGDRGAAPGAMSFHDAWMADTFPRVIAGDLPAPDSVLRRLVRGQLRQRRPVRRRDHAGADSRDREALPGHPRTLGALADRRIDRRLGSAGAPDLSIPTSSAARGRRAPDPVTFTDVEGVNVYKDDNAFYKVIGDFHRTPTVNSREVNGEIRQTAQQRYWMELVNGTHGRSGTGQQDIWQAVFGPIGADGYFKPLVDSRTGAIDKSVAQYWKEHYDLLYYLQRHWATIGAETGRQAARVCRQHGQLLSRARRPRDGGVDEDDRGSARRGLLHVRRPEAALLERSRYQRRSHPRDGRVRPAQEAGGDDDPVVAGTDPPAPLPLRANPARHQAGESGAQEQQRRRLRRRRRAGVRELIGDVAGEERAADPTGEMGGRDSAP
jgi:hypothetical protein